MSISKDGIFVMKILTEHRETMRAKLNGIGEPAVKIPLSDIQIFRGEMGENEAIICMDKLLCLIDAALRS